VGKNKKIIKQGGNFMAKKDYTMLSLEICEFQTADVITASKGNNFASAPDSWLTQGGFGNEE
jgi:hypothetical protein